ncbi:NADH-quinone oxidoreductase subunit C [Lacibacter sp. H375]|uniref:NADH-quinone oxidoreductase subunit C n=1 Tax=Lacibacter sp. H375 TaxID=3133424 RepID=UPI0030BE8BD4
MLLFNTAEISKALQDKLGEEVISLASLQAAGRDAIFIHPSSQLQVFNFLFYERQWRFDRLHDMILIFEPGTIANSYRMQFQLGSRYYANRLDISIPFTLQNSKLYSMKHLYSSATKFEKLMTEIHGIEFKHRSTAVERLRQQVKSLMMFFPV